MIWIASAAPSGTQTLTFSSIPQTFTHLQLRGFVQQTRATYGISDGYIQFNSDSANNYSWHQLYGNGVSAISYGAASTSRIDIADGQWGSSTGGTFGVSITDILDYANTSKFKTTRTLNGVDINGEIASFGGRAGLLSGNWRSTSAITSMTVVAANGNYIAGTRFDLYGITSSQVTGA
jgi:hypothetical protein